MLEVINVSKKYISKKRRNIFFSEKISKIAIDNVSLTIPRGKVIGVLGENGAGKTTLIKMMCTLLIPDSGIIKIDGKNIQTNLKSTRKRINIISGGEKNLYWRLSGFENMEYFAALYGIPKKESKERIMSLLREVGLEKHKDIPVEQYSKGMKQRLQIAKGLINYPDYLFLDEPTLGLDVSIALDLRKKIKNIAKKYNTGILLTTHYMAEAEELCDYLYILCNGKVVLSGTKNEVFKQANLKTELIITLDLIDDNTKKLIFKLKENFKNIEFYEEECVLKLLSCSEIDIYNFTNELFNYGIKFNQIKINQPSLEDVFSTI